MADFDTGELRILRAARLHASPSEADARRVLEATLRAVGSPPGDTSGPGGEGRTNASAGTGAGGMSWVRPWVARGVIAVVAGGAGYALGHHQGASSSTSHPPASARANEAAEQRDDRLPPSMSVQTAPSSASPAGTHDEKPESPKVAGLGSAQGSSGSSALRRPERSLDEEVRTLARVERSLREQNPRLALALLDEMDATIGSGKMMEERRATRVVARCQLEPESRAALANAFIDRHPRSVYLERVAQACGKRAAR